MTIKVPHSEMLSMTSGLTKTYTDQIHDHLLSLLTNPTRFKEANDRFHASYNALLAGDTGMAATCEEHRKKLDREYSLLMGIAKVVAQIDPGVTEKLGLGPLTAKTCNTVASLMKPDGFKLVYGKNSGEMTGQVQYMKNVRMYEAWGCIGDPNVEENWKLLAASPNCHGIEIKGLIPGTKYWFRVRAMRKGQAGPWSNYITMMAI